MVCQKMSLYVTILYWLGLKSKRGTKMSKKFLTGMRKLTLRLSSMSPTAFMIQTYQTFTGRYKFLYVFVCGTKRGIKILWRNQKTACYLFLSDTLLDTRTSWKLSNFLEDQASSVWNISAHQNWMRKNMKSWYKRTLSEESTSIKQLIFCLFYR